MATRRRFGKKLFKSLLPILLILFVALFIALGAIVRGITRPPRQAFLVTPESFTQFSGRVLKVTDETWRNRDGSTARGWLLRGGEGAPAIVLLHRYGGDRSWLFNLGVKLNEAGNATILWPDMRGHGLNPPVKWSGFGGREGDDVLAALDFLRSLKGDNRPQLISESVGVYGVELGAYAALRAASQDSKIQAVVLDSLPRTPDELVNAALYNKFGVGNSTLLFPARVATRIYFVGKYDNTSSCDLAERLKTPRVLLLAGVDDGPLREATRSTASCFPTPANLDVRTDLPLTGYTLPSATGVQGEAYDRPVIDFFVKNLR
jgi:pimeloyl-ACP methyl ester carboxylesterase